MRARELFSRFAPSFLQGERKPGSHEPAENDLDRDRIKRLRKKLARKARELETLRAELEQAQKAAPRISFDGVPVFFIVGRAKSGTSWLMKLLDAHPEILCRGEGRFFGRGFKQEDLEKARQGRIQPSSLYRAILEAGYLEGWIEKSVWTRGDDVEEHLRNLTRVATSYFLAQRLAKTGKKIVGDKTPFLGDEILEEIGEIYPGAKVIHIIRDGRDTAVSLMHHRWNLAKDEGGIYDLKPKERAKRDAYRTDPEGAIEAGISLFPEGMLRNMAVGWKDQISRAREDGKRLLGENYAEVRYEDLLEQPEVEMRRLLEFLGADADEGVIGKCVEAASFEKLSKGRERGEEDPSSFFRKGISGDWKNVFTGEDKRVFKEAAGDLLIELGYEKNDNW